MSFLKKVKAKAKDARDQALGMVAEASAIKDISKGNQEKVLEKKFKDLDGKAINNNPNLPWKFPADYYCTKCDNTGYKDKQFTEVCPECWLMLSQGGVYVNGQPVQTA
ncbi:hypothetical protein DASC09_006270 [Saccharomycopsis crataegensis]|uniref:Uncharacterized protein n=1 Tax=Saccharomycopsis crataegensis TaxID=43959 RepID=A0AAV5QF97_9ASCO|nr:hypothetical protein DASC09_006270 [Saccharomycopsis crataegensis]